MSFQDLGLSPEILRAIVDSGYTAPTPVQKEAIPLILAGSDIIADAQTGTGKTAGFTLPMLHRLRAHSHGKPQGHRPLRALILTPTRELAAQVAQSVTTYGKYTDLKSTVIYGGVSIGPQINALRRGVDILIATPGRLLDHVSQGTVDLSKVEIFILDEADRMLDMGFIVDIKKVIELLPKNRQSLLFSATISPAIKKLGDALLKSPQQVKIERSSTSNALVTQVVHPVDGAKKRELLVHLITEGKWKQVLVFTRTKHAANKLSTHLDNQGIRSTAIHGNKTQGARSKALNDFKRGSVQVLVATDVAARGLDIDLLPHVVNFELPHVPEDYVHRIGRTGRAGNEGAAVSLVCVDEIKLLKDIERLLKMEIPRVQIPGFEPDPSIRGEPIRIGGRGGRQGPPRGDRPQGDRPRGDRPRGDRPRGDRPRGDRPFNDRPREPRPYGDRPRSDQPREPRPYGDRPQSDRPREPRPYGDRPRSDQPREARPYGDRPQGDRPRSPRPYGDRPQGDRPRGPRLYGDRSKGDQPQGERSFNRSGPGGKPKKAPYSGRRSDSTPRAPRD